MAQSAHIRLIDAYNQQVQEGKLKPDAAQADVVDQCQLFQDKLYDWCANQTSLKRFLPFRRPDEPGHLYIYGDVGRGKSMIMDLLYQNTQDIPKMRMHFHEFMRMIHEKLHALRSKGQGEDPIPILANALRNDTILLCFDEFFVNDITDAMIMSRLFTALFDRGIKMVTTSNIAPHYLYKDGLQRSQFIPFIELLEAKATILTLDSDTDFRLRHLSHIGHIYLTPHTKQTESLLFKHFEECLAGNKSTPQTINLKGRSLTTSYAHDTMALFSFDQLCASAMGASDYLTLAQRFKTIFLTNIPQFTNELNNEAKRFITLIDVLYEKHVHLVCTAAAKPEKLYQSGKYKFEFKRTVSRLIEMQSEAYAKP